MGENLVEGKQKTRRRCEGREETWMHVMEECVGEEEGDRSALERVCEILRGWFGRRVDERMRKGGVRENGKERMRRIIGGRM